MAGGGGGVGWENFATYCHGRGGVNFFLAYFLGGAKFLTYYCCELFFYKSDITCIITVVGAQEQHKGMFLKT